MTVAPRGEEVVARLAHLGMRLVDDHSGRPVTDGLRVRVRRAGRATHVAAACTPSGVWAVHTLPGTPRFLPRGVEGAGKDDIIGLVPQAQYEVTVDDVRERFHPVVVRAGLPDASGMLDDPCAGTGMTGVLSGVFVLPSMPARPTPADRAVVRVQVTYGAPARAAAYCVVDVRVDGVDRGRAVADARGQVTACFPYPEPRATVGTPPAWGSQTWAVEVGVRHDPPADGDPRIVRGADGLDRLDLCRVLDQAPAGDPVAGSLTLGRPPALSVHVP